MNIDFLGKLVQFAFTLPFLQVNHTCAKVIHSLDRNSQPGKTGSAKTG